MSNPADPSTSAAESGVPPTAPAQSAASQIISPVKLVAALALTGAVAAIAASLLVEEFGHPFALSAEATAGIGVVPTPEQAARVTLAKRVRDGKNLYVTFALMGGEIGLAFGVVLGLLRRSTRAALLGLAGGAVFGAGLGAAGGFAVGSVSEFLKSAASLENEHRVIIAHLAGWAITGIGIGMGAALGMGERRAVVKGLLAGFAGGLIGGGIYVPIAAILMPTVDTDLVIPDSWSAKLVWIAVPAVLMGVGLGRALSAGHKKSTAAAAVS
jgi:hypothetical protein